MYYSKFSTAVLSGVALVLCQNAFSAEKSLAELEVEVKQVLSEPDNVARRKIIAPVFQLAERYAWGGQTNEALEYFTKALEHQPWNLEAQLAAAQLLYAKGETNAARQKAELVWSRAETDNLLSRASQILEKPFETELPDKPWPENTNALALVPIGKVDAWLMRELRAELEKNLGIPVIIQRLQMDIPEPKRDAVRLKANDLRERIATAYKVPDFQALMRKLNLSTNGFSDDEKVFAFAKAALNEERDKNQVGNFREELAFLRRVGPQWDSTELVTSMTKKFGAQPGGQRAFLGVTTMDLYANESRFVFGIAANGANCGIISYRRYTSVLADEPPNQGRLKERTLKQALSSTGLMFGLARCTDPTCARAYGNGLAEHDAKQPRLCSQCVEAFAKRFSQ